MNNVPNKTLHIPKRSSRTLNRFSKRIAFPSIVIGTILILAFLTFAPEPRSTVAPTDFAYDPNSFKNEYAANSSISRESARSNTNETNSRQSMESLIQALEPKIELLETEIAELQTADEVNWKNQRYDVVQAWNQLSETFESLN